VTAVHRSRTHEDGRQAVRVWEQARDAFTPFLAFSPPVRKLPCTTNIESLNYQLRKVTKVAATSRPTTLEKLHTL
jgi:transposase-like protein